MATVPFAGRSRTITEDIRRERANTSKAKNKVSGNILDKLIRKKNNQEIILEETLDVDKDIERFSHNTLGLLKPTEIYSKNKKEGKIKLYQHYRKTKISVISNEDTELISLIDKEGYDKLKQEKLNLMHLGLIVVGVKGLTRKDVGAKVMVSILDTRWTNQEKAIIGCMEIDMN